MTRSCTRPRACWKTSSITRAAAWGCPRAPSTCACSSSNGGTPMRWRRTVAKAFSASMPPAMPCTRSTGPKPLAPTPGRPWSRAWPMTPPAIRRWSRSHRRKGASPVPMSRRYAGIGPRCATCITSMPCCAETRRTASARSKPRAKSGHAHCRWRRWSVCCNPWRTTRPSWPSSTTPAWCRSSAARCTSWRAPAPGTTSSTRTSICMCAPMACRSVGACAVLPTTATSTRWTASTTTADWC